MTDFDFELLYLIQQYCRCRLLDSVMPVITHLGSAGIIWILIAGILIFMKQYRLCGMKMLTGMLMGLLIGNLLLKNLIARERPCWTDTEILMMIAVPRDYSFPSGHTMASVISTVILFQENKKFGIAALILTILIAFSRMYLFVHFPSDILGGAILGILIGFFVPTVWTYFLKKQQNPSS